LSKCLGVQEEIQQLKNDFEKAMKSKDVKTIVSLYSDDAVIAYGKMMPICKDSKEVVNLVFLIIITNHFHKYEFLSEFADWYKTSGFLGEDIGYKECECKTIPMGSDFAQQRGVFAINMNGKSTKAWYYNCDFKLKTKQLHIQVCFLLQESRWSVETILGCIWRIGINQKQDFSRISDILDICKTGRVFQHFQSIGN
jgi:hypothetical protein